MGGGIYREQELIARGEGVSTGSRSQSCEGRGYLQGSGANRARGGGIQRLNHLPRVLATTRDGCSWFSRLGSPEQAVG
eukprot:668544-Prorocentrum_minimum.AAC.2